jgi:hypothetical protein
MESTILSTDLDPPARCTRSDRSSFSSETARSYLYLLGQYLGDGHLVTTARVPVLRIYACTDYPEIVDEIREAIRVVRDVRPGLVRHAASDRLVGVQSYWNHWPCLLPQHGPGHKHERSIVLADWQSDLVRRDPWPLIRGLIHSDGCRSLNTIRRGSTTYRYPRYLFSNESPDIIGIFTAALDLVGVSWRMCRRNLASVARRHDVAVMDEHIGPKT